MCILSKRRFQVINKKLFKTGAIAVPVIIAIFIISGCTTKKADVWGDPSSGLILQYRMTEGDVLKYEMSSEKVEITDVMGQSMESHTQSSSSLAFLSNASANLNAISKRSSFLASSIAGIVLIKCLAVSYILSLRVFIATTR